MSVLLWEGQKAQELVDAVNNRNMFSDGFKNALLNICRHVAYVDGNGQDYYNALVAAFDNAAEPWDVDFNYKDGLLMDNGFYNNWPEAWTGTESYSSNGIVLDTSNAEPNGGISIAPKVERSANNYNGGVYEIMFSITNMPAVHSETSGTYIPNGRGLRVCPVLGGAGVGVTIAINENGLYYYGGSLAAGYIRAVQNILENHLYKLRVEVDGSSSAVYLDDVLVCSDIQYQTTAVPSKLQLVSDGVVLIRDIKIRYS